MVCCAVRLLAFTIVVWFHCAVEAQQDTQLSEENDRGAHAHTSTSSGSLSQLSQLHLQHAAHTGNQGNTSTTVADAASPHNWEAVQREACTEGKPAIGSVHSAVQAQFWEELYGEQAPLLEQWEVEWRAFVDAIPPYEGSAAMGQGRGVVYAAGAQGFHTLLLSVRLLRGTGCALPVEVWHFPGELSAYHVEQLDRLGVRTRDISDASNFVTIELNPSMPKPYDIKPTAIINSAFEEVLFLDHDNLALQDPTHLFDSPEFKSTGAMFWGDFWKTDPRNPIYPLLRVPCYDEREFESGQMVINKRVSWKALELTWFMNRHNANYYRMVFGDKDTFRFAWKAVEAPYHYIKYPPAEVGFITEVENQFCGHTLGQYDPSGAIMFLHTHLLKWNEWKGVYQFTTWRDMRNNFSSERPWTAVQEVKDDPNLEAFRPQWLRAMPETPCLQYVLRQPGEEHIMVFPHDAKPDKKKEILPHVAFAEAVPQGEQWYQLFNDVEGPLLAVAPFFRKR